jgi:deoxycytidine triphosphate deaminase
MLLLDGRCVDTALTGWLAQRIGTIHTMILSDTSIREALAESRIIIEPLGESAIQPSSVDLHVDRYFRVFRNDTTPYIDPKQPQEELTELVEVSEGQAFILHPGEFVLGSTMERVALPDDLVARLEGKSSLGRLGLLIHSSLPGSEPVLVLDEAGRLAPRRIEEVVKTRLRGSVVSFDPETFEVGYHAITGWYEGPPDRIYEVNLSSGRRVRVTAGHCLFGLGRDGSLSKLRAQAIGPGTRLAVPDVIPDPNGARSRVDSLDSVAAPADPAPMRVRPNVGVVLADRWQPPLRIEALRQLHPVFAPSGSGAPGQAATDAQTRGELRWDTVVEVVDTGKSESIYDLEVRPGGRAIENFVAGSGGVFVANTAGFVDAGWDGHLTLELSNVANLPIAIYPGMKIGQISFLSMTTPAEHPYGSDIAGSKYQGQRGPTPSRYYLNFQDDD